MKVLKLILIVGVVYFGYGKYQESLSSDNPMLGEWKSNKSLTMKELYKVGLSKQEKAIFNNVLGKATLTVSNSSWEIVADSYKFSKEYKIVSIDDKCFQVILNKTEKVEACVYKDVMYISSSFSGAFSDVKDVYSRI